MTIFATEPITLRPAHADDHPALARLAALDSTVVPPAPLLVAELDGAMVVALSLSDATAIADPFARTADIVELLRAHAARCYGGHDRGLRGRLLAFPRLRVGWPRTKSTRSQAT